MISSHTAIFAALDAYCSRKGAMVANVGVPRWISTATMHHHFIMHSIVSECLMLSSKRKLARLDLKTRSYLITIGFDEAVSIFSAAEVDLNPAFLTVALAELTPAPTATANEIKDVVEWSDQKADRNYTGHEYLLLASLFPRIRVFDITGRESQDTWNIFFTCCVDECNGGGTWIEGKLVEDLKALCELDSRRIPYRVLCRSIFDGDRSSFFLAQYRCLEALYSYASAQSLSRSLQIQAGWSEVATALEDCLGWHPREESSLERILRFAISPDLMSILQILGKDIPNEREIIVPRSAKAIYSLRNSIVHYRPAQKLIRVEDFNWVGLCAAMTGIILDVYHAVFSGEIA